MKRLFCAALLALGGLGAGPVIAMTPDTVKEYFSGPDNGLVQSSRARAVRITDSKGTSWHIRIQTSTPVVSGAYRRTVDLFSVEDGQKILKVCKLLISLRDKAKASAGDVYERRIGVTDSLDILYRLDKNADNTETFWLGSSELGPEQDGGVEMDRDAFQGLTNSLEAALETINFYSK